MTDKIVLVYERLSAGRYEYILTGIVIPMKIWKRELPCSPREEVEIRLLDTIYNEEDVEELRKIKEDPNFIPLEG